MSSKRRSFDEKLEPLIYWDTTFAFTAFSAIEPFHAECVAFRKRLDAEGVGERSEHFLKVDDIIVYTCLP